MAQNITIRDAKIIFRNFSGKQKEFNPEGRRNFSVIIDEETANMLRNEGWNVKPLRKRDEQEEQTYHLPVAVFFGAYPPTIVMVMGNRKVGLTEDTVNELDWAQIQKVDLTIRPREYEARGMKGVKAYLKTMYVTIEEDELAKDYAYLDNSATIADDDDVPF